MPSRPDRDRQPGRAQPYEMNVYGHAVHSTSLAEAMPRFTQAKGRGAKFIDIGCMQINRHFHHFHGADFRSLSEIRSGAQRRIRCELCEVAQGAGRLMDAGGRPLQCGAGQSGGGKDLRLLGHPQHGRERFRTVDGQRPRALPVVRGPAIPESGSSFFKGLRRHFRVASGDGAPPPNASASTQHNQRHL
jgi:hypothetical protein